MPLKIESVEEPSLNLTPMIDVVFLLIIFFMVGSHFTELERQYDIQVPTVSDAPALSSAPDAITINVRRSGEVIVDDQVRTLAELEADLKSARTNFPGQAVVIRGDGEGIYQHVMDVLAVCERVRIRNIALANRLNSEGSP
jgi:biopolymer transport protein ExbD